MRVRAAPEHPFGEHQLEVALSAYLGRDAPSCADHFPRTISGGLALPPRQLPPDAPRTVTLEVPPDAITMIMNAVTNAVAAIRRAAAERGIS